MGSKTTQIRNRKKTYGKQIKLKDYPELEELCKDLKLIQDDLRLMNAKYIWD